MTTNAPAPATSILRIEISPRSVVLILATIAGVWLTYQLRLVVLMLVIALILAGTFNPLIEWMEARGVKRVLALLLVFGALTLTAAFVIFLTLPPLVEQLTHAVQNAPATHRRIVAVLSERSVTVPLAEVVRDTKVDELFTRLEGYLLGYSVRAARAIGFGVTTLVLSFYLMADGMRTQGVLYAIVPRDYHMRLARILQNMQVIVGGYMRGQLFTCALIGVFTFLLLAVLRGPNALSLALLAAVVDVIPFIGGFLVIIPAVLSALPQGLPTAGLLCFIQLIYMEFESRILVPKVYGHVLRLSPTVVVLSLVAGGILMGIVGALLALPIAAGLQMMLEELRVEMPGDDSLDRPTRARHARQEARYEEMSAGATAPEAAEIAKHFTQDIRDAELELAAAAAAREAATAARDAATAAATMATATAAAAADRESAATDEREREGAE